MSNALDKRANGKGGEMVQETEKNDEKVLVGYG